MSIDKRYVKQSVTGGERLRSQEKNGTQECMCIKKIKKSLACVCLCPAPF